MTDEMNCAGPSRRSLGGGGAGTAQLLAELLEQPLERVAAACDALAAAWQAEQRGFELAEWPAGTACRPIPI